MSGKCHSNGPLICKMICSLITERLEECILPLKDDLKAIERVAQEICQVNFSLYFLSDVKITRKVPESINQILKQNGN